jgi:tyramine---L-glutamate ligase
MKIALFEWLCGGGMYGQDPEVVPAGLLLEGWAMLITLARQFQAAGHEVVTVIDDRLVTPPQLASLPAAHAKQFKDYSRMLVGENAECNTIDAWTTFAGDSAVELALIIAPEIDGILQHAIASFQASQIPTLNCSGAFLDRSCDKWLTAACLKSSQVPHPPTQLASEWLRSDDESTKQWCLKSRLGAGCEGLWIGNYLNLISKIESLSDPASWIVQPWLDGKAYSCSAIVDRRGKATWLPLVTQSFELFTQGNARTLHYRGGKIVDSSGPSRPDELLSELQSVLGSSHGEALGWVGVDLLLRANGQWVVIEVNPRVTTSILGLCLAAPGNLACSMIDAFSGKDSAGVAANNDTWRIVEFSPQSGI